MLWKTKMGVNISLYFYLLVLNHQFWTTNISGAISDSARDIAG